MPIRVLLAGNCPLKNQGIHARIAATDELLLVETTEERDQLPDLCTFHQPDLLLIILDGWAKPFESLAQRLPEMNILGLFNQNERSCHALIRSGVINGCLPETAPPEIVIQAIRAVVGGNTWLSLTFSKQKLAAEMTSALADDELTLLRLLAAGDTDTGMANAFQVSTRTIQRRVKKICQKLGVRTRAEAAYIAGHRRMLEG